MRRISLALALVGAVAVTGCSGGSKPAANTDAGVQKGVTGQFYYVNLFSPPIGGVVTSDIGGINCGAQSRTILRDGAGNPVLDTFGNMQYATSYFSSGGVETSHCGQTQFQWAQTVVLTATAQGTNAFIGWAGSCSGTGTCSLSAGADKTVVAIFGPPGSGHGNFTDPAVHGPAFYAGVLDCAKCHGANLTGQGNAPSCTSCHGAKQANGLKVAITSVTSTTAGIVVTFTTRDNQNAVVDIKGNGNTAVVPNISLSSFTTDGNGQVLQYAVRTGNTTTNQAAPYYGISSGNRITMPSVSPAGTTTVGSAGLLLENTTPGDYKYTFPSYVVFNPVFAAATHTIWIQATRQENTALATSSTFTARNEQYNFLVPTALNTPAVASSSKREIVSQDLCDKCHDGFKPRLALTSTTGSTFHGGGRVNANYCNVCHNSVRMQGSSAEADSLAFVHIIHGAREMGMPSSLWFTGIGATYPQTVMNCGSCHPNTTQGNQWKTHPTRAACGSCHYTVDFTTGANHGPSDMGGPQANDSGCTTCHTSGTSAWPIATSHFPVIRTGNSTSAVIGAGPLGTPLPTGVSTITYSISSVSVFPDASGVNHPQMTFQVLKDGVAQNFGNAASTSSELMAGFTGGPSIYFAAGVPQDGIALPADYNTTASQSLKTAWNTASANYSLTVDGANNYTLRLNNAILPPSFALLTGSIGFGFFTQTGLSAFPDGIIVPTTNVSLSVGTGRRAIVSTTKCTACHAQLGVEPTFHGGARNDGATCAFCHTTRGNGTGWSYNSSTFIHAIHGAAQRTEPYRWVASCPSGSTWVEATKLCMAGTASVDPTYWFDEVEYPQNLTTCSACHVGTSFAMTGVDTTKLLWTTVATGTLTNLTPAAQMSAAPEAYGVSYNVNYGTGFTYCAAPSTRSPCNVPANVGVAIPASATTLVSSPIAAACFSCHDSVGSKTHIELMGGKLYKARSAAAIGTAEGCLECHGTGKGFDVAAVH